MSNTLKGLAGETIIYGATTMVGRLLNWLLMPFYIRTLAPEEYGVIINLYGIISILLVIFTYGLETGFFRFAREGKYHSVYRTTLIMLSSTSLLLVIIVWLFSGTVSEIFYQGQFRVAVFIAGVVIAIDAFLSVPFANLRLNNKPLRFGVIRLTGIFINIILNVFFLLIVPYLINNLLIDYRLVQLYQQQSGVFYVLLSNLISSIVMFLFFIKDFSNLKGSFDIFILRSILIYSWPILIVGITGMVIQNSDKILMPLLIREDGIKELAVYGANFKIGIIMTLFTQSFRFAFEPYFFKNKEKGMENYSRIMDYFIFFGIFIFLGVTIFQDVINILLTDEYTYGNIIIPFILLAQLFYGIYFNLSLWYKLCDKTVFGAIFGVFGSVVTVALNFILIPLFGMLGAAIAMLAGYFLMMIASWFFAQKYYPVPYPLKRIALYFLAGGLIFLVNYIVAFDIAFYHYLFKAVIFVCFIFIFVIIQKFVSAGKNIVYD